MAAGSSLHQTLERHPKLFDLMALMGWDIDTTIGKVHRFWWWCVDYAEDGDLRRHNDARIGAAVGLNGGDAPRFVTAMVEACWLDRDPYFRVHDWWDYAGRFLQVKYKNRPGKWQAVRDAYKNTNAQTKDEGGCEEGSEGGCKTLNISNLTTPNLTTPKNPSARDPGIRPVEGMREMDTLLKLRQWGATKEEAERAMTQFNDKPAAYLQKVILTHREQQPNASQPTARPSANDRAIARLRNKTS